MEGRRGRSKLIGQKGGEGGAHSAAWLTVTPTPPAFLSWVCKGGEVPPAYKVSR